MANGTRSSLIGMTMRWYWNWTVGEASVRLQDHRAEAGKSSLTPLWWCWETPSPLESTRASRVGDNRTFFSECSGKSSLAQTGNTLREIWKHFHCWWILLCSRIAFQKRPSRHQAFKIHCRLNRKFFAALPCVSEVHLSLHSQLVAVKYVCMGAAGAARDWRTTC